MEYFVMNKQYTYYEEKLLIRLDSKIQSNTGVHRPSFLNLFFSVILLYICIYACMCVRVRARVCVYVCLSVCVCERVCACMCLCVHVSVCVCVQCYFRAVGRGVKFPLNFSDSPPKMLRHVINYSYFK